MPRSIPGRARAAVAVAAIVALIVPGTPAQGGAVNGMLAKVKMVADGDTIDVDLNFDGTVDERVRLHGIDTPEMGTCGANGARNKLIQLLDGKKVKLYADHASSSASKGRLLRRVKVKKNGVWKDATQWMLRRGYGIWKPDANEKTNAETYHRAAERAAAEGKRYWDDDRCGTGPVQSANFEIQVQWKADSMSGGSALNQEFIRITNHGNHGVDVDRWILRTGGKRNLTIPKGKRIAPGKTLTVHIGSGTNSRYHRYFGRSSYLLPDVTPDDDPYRSDGVYLLDKDGDIRGHQTWPCIVACGDPYGGTLTIGHVEYDPPGSEAADLNTEWFEITNSGPDPINTGDVVVEIWPYVYEFPPAHTLQSGESVTFYSGDGSNTRLARYLDAGGPVLSNPGDKITVRTFDGIQIDCAAWGDQSC